MPTLDDYRKAAGYKTIKAFAEKAGIKPSLMSQWLKGFRSDQDDKALITLLGITWDQYDEAYDESRELTLAQWRVKHPPTMTEEAFHQSIKEAANRAYERMTPAERARIHEDAIRLGVISPDTRSPLDRMIDQACGLE